LTGLVPVIHAEEFIEAASVIRICRAKRVWPTVDQASPWMTGTSPAMTARRFVEIGLTSGGT
jgi:hypothetical protein